MVCLIAGGASALEPHFRPENDPKTGLQGYVRTVTSRIAQQLYRQGLKRPDRIPLDALLDVPCPPTTDRSPGEWEDRVRREVSQAVGALDEKERELLRLKVEEEFSNAKIAKFLQVSEVAVRVRWHRLKKKLTRILRTLRALEGT